MTPKLIAEIREILEPTGTRFDPVAYCPLSGGVADTRRGAYLDFRAGTFRVRVSGTAPGFELGYKEVDRLGNELANLAQIIFRLRNCRAPILERGE